MNRSTRHGRAFVHRSISAAKRVRLSLTALITAISYTLAMPVISSAASSDISKTGTCGDGFGNVVMVVQYGLFAGATVSAHGAGPTGVSWSRSLPTGPGMDLERTIALVTPITTGTFQVSSSVDAPLSLSLKCQRKTVRDGTPAATKALGEKSCASGNVEITGYTFATLDTWFFWRGSADGPMNHTDFIGGGLNSLLANDNHIFDARVEVFDANPDPGQSPLVDATLTCGLN